MMGAWFLLAKVFKAGSRISDLKGPAYEELPALKISALLTMWAGITVGLLRAGVIPGLEKFNVGIASLQAWLTAFIVYMPLRILDYRKDAESQPMQLEHTLGHR
jgi:hypothetical protein